LYQSSAEAASVGAGVGRAYISRGALASAYAHIQIMGFGGGALIASPLSVWLI
jgi:hypothetical protein